MTTTIRRARREHRCCECDGTIKVGDTYEYVSGVWDNQGASFKTCLACAGIRKWYVYECLPRYECWPCYGDLIQDATDNGNCARADLVMAATSAGYL
jgi:hypothetical protein